MKSPYNAIVFDCQDMPLHAHRAYMEITRGAGNDVYLEWYWKDLYEYPPQIFSDEDKKIEIVQTWMLQECDATWDELQTFLDAEGITLVKRWW